MFNKVLPQPSELITVTLPRPLGVVFEYDQPRKWAVVVDVVPGSAAAQRMKVAGLNPRLAKETVQPGGWCCVCSLQRDSVRIVFLHKCHAGCGDMHTCIPALLMDCGQSSEVCWPLHATTPVP